MKLKDFSINGVTFQTSRLPIMTRVVLDAKVARLIAPILGSLGIGAIKDIKSVLDLNIDLDSILLAIGESLEKLPQEQVMSLIKDLIKTTTAFRTGTAAHKLDNEDSIDAIFEEDHHTLYLLAIQIMKDHKIIPFVGIGGGLQTKAMSTHEESTENASQTGPKLGM